jgi:hypothetical protein
MRALLGIAIAAVVIITAWSTNSTVAKHTAVSIEPAGMMMATTNLPGEQFDAF